MQNTIELIIESFFGSHVFGSGCSSSDVELSLVSPGELVVPGPRPAVVVSIVLGMSWSMMTPGVAPMVSPMTMAPAPVRDHLGGHGVGVGVAPAWRLTLSAAWRAGVASRAVCSLRRGGQSSAEGTGEGPETHNWQTALLGSRQQNELH